MTRPLAFVVILFCCGLAACGSSPTTPTVTTLAGNWSGTLSDNFAGSGTVAFTFAQTGSAVTGTWATTYPNPAFNNGGSISGTASGVSVTAVLSPSIPTTCPFNVVATRSGNTLSGTYAAFNCSVAASGTFTATKK